MKSSTTNTFLRKLISGTVIATVLGLVIISHRETDESVVERATDVQSVSNLVLTPEISESFTAEMPEAVYIPEEESFVDAHRLHFDSYDFDLGSVVEWREKAGANGSTVEGILKYGIRGLVYFDAELTDQGDWEVRRSAFLGEYILQNDVLPLEEWEELGYLDSGYIEITQSNRLFSHISVDVESLEQMDIANSVILGDLAEAVGDMNALVYPVATPNDPEYAGSWTLAKLNIEPVWEAYGFSPEAALGRRPVIAVIDNGASASNPDWHIWINENEIPGNGKDDDGNGYVDDVSGYNFAKYNADMSFAGGHGTTVSKIAASLSNNGLSIASPASSASLMRVLYYEDAIGGHFAAISAMLYAIDNGADVVNCSFVSTSSTSFSSTLAAAREKNTIIVAAAGNNRRDLGSYPLFPIVLNDENMIGVGASDTADALGASNFCSNDLDVFAPGGATSYTTPLVTSTVALLKQIKPGATYNEIRLALIDGVDQNPALDGLCVSGGRLNVRGAVEALIGQSLSGVEPEPTTPSVPSLKVSSVNTNKIGLEWSVAGTVDGFEIEFSEGGSAFVDLEPTAMFQGTARSVLVENLKEKTSYVFRIRSVKGALSSAWKESGSVTTLEPAPVAPLAPSIDIGNVGVGTIDLTWSTSESVDSFEVQVTISGKPYAAVPGGGIYGGHVSGAQMSGLGEGVDCRFRIRAIRDGVASLWKTSLQATTLEPAPVAPSAPSIAIGNVGIGTIALSWSASESVTSFEVQMSTAGGAYTALSGGGIYGGTETGVQLSGLGEGVDYRFRIRAVREGLSSNWTVSDLATTLVPAPVAPSAPSIAIGNVGIGTIALSWSASESVTSFEVQMSTAGGAYTALSGGGIYGGTETGVQLSGLGEGVDYRFRIRAVREGLSSNWTVSDLATTLVPAPVAPSAPSIAIGNVGIGTIALSWSASESVTSFEVQMSTAGGAYTALSGGGIYGGTETGVQLSGLGEGVDYRFRIRAVREGLSSNWTVSDLATTLVPAPVAPSAPSIAIGNVGIGTIALSWSASESVTSFEVQMSTAGGAYTALSGGGIYGGTETGVQLSGLGEGVDYRFRIRAVREGLSSPWTVSAVATTLKPTKAGAAPTAPSMNITSIGADWILLTWSISEEVDDFEIKVSVGGTAYTSLDGGSFFDGALRSLHLTGLSKGVDYRFRICAYRDSKKSPWMTTEVVTTLESDKSLLPLPIVKVDSVGIGSIDISWNTTESVDGFELQMSEAGAEFADVELTDPLSGDESSVQLLGLGEGVSYAFRIRSVKAGTTSEWALSSTVTTLEPAPQAPAAPVLSASLVEITSVSLSWSIAESVDGFELQISEAGSAYEDLEAGLILSQEDTSLLVQDLLDSADYRFRIRSIRSGLVSSWTESTVLTTESTPWPKAEHNWKFNGGAESIAYDSGSLTLDLDLGSHPGIGWGDGIGVLQTGLEFASSHKGVVVPDSEAINLSAQRTFTLSLWVKLSGDPSKKTSVLYEQGGFWRGLNLIVDKGWLFASGWNRPVKESDWAGTTLQGGKLPTDQWSHVVLVLDASETIRENGLTLYVNGQAVATGPASMVWANMEKTGIGQVQGGTVFRDREVRRLDPFEGSIDNLNIWCCALSAEEIQAFYESASAN